MDDEKKSAVCLEVLRQSSHRLYFEMRFLEQAIFTLIPEENSLIFFGGDGESLYFESEYLLKRYLQDPASVACDYLHTVIHCLYQHPFLAFRHDEKYWNLASDIAVADVFGELGVSWITEQIPEECLEIADQIREKVPMMSADYIAMYLQDEFSTEESLFGYRYEELERLFKRDSHECWRGGSTQKGEEEDASEGESAGENLDDSEVSAGERSQDSEGGNAGENLDDSEVSAGERPQDSDGDGRLSEVWKDIARSAVLHAESFSKGRGEMPANMRKNIQKLTREQYDYTEFLRKFAVFQERMKVNMDEFDYSYYMYGLRIFGKIPLIEPLEYREEKQIREFAIVIDTSGSCSGELVERFLNKTYNILCQEECFADRIALHIIQCDARVQQDVRIDSLENMEKFIREMTLFGGGGTDFRPAFEYVDRLCQIGEFKRLHGMIYFTDGDGIFPQKPPDYKTAFVFVKREDDVRVPPWAMRIYLDHI